MRGIRQMLDEHFLGHVSCGHWKGASETNRCESDDEGGVIGA